MDVVQLYDKCSLCEIHSVRSAFDESNPKQVLAMRKRIKVTGFSDWDSMYYNNLLSIPILAIFSLIVEDWGTDNLSRNLLVILSQTTASHLLNRVAVPWKQETLCFPQLHFLVQLLWGYPIQRHGVSERRVAQLTGEVVVPMSILFPALLICSQYGWCIE
jgi:hypothetical protein